MKRDDSGTLRTLMVPCLMVGLALGISNPARAYVDPLTEEEIAAIQQLSPSELIELIKSGDWQHASHALGELLRDGCSISELETLVEVAKHHYSRTIIERLALTIYDETASDEDKRRVDRFIDLLEEPLKNWDPPGFGLVAVDGLARTITHDPEYKNRQIDQGRWPDPPYANGRVTDILIWCLDHKHFGVRHTAIRWLSSVGGNDPGRAEDILAKLKAQRIKEEEAQDFEERHRQGFLFLIEQAITDIERRINQARQLSATTPEQRSRVR